MSTKYAFSEKALYGLRQSPRAWYSRIDLYRRQRGPYRNPADQNIYQLEKGLVVVLILYVNDLMVTGNHEEKIKWIIHQLEKEFEMSKLGNLQLQLNVEFQEMEYGVFRSQRTGMQKMRKEFGSSDCKPAVTTLPEGFHVEHEEQTSLTEPTYCRKIVGKLLYLTKYKA